MCRQPTHRLPGLSACSLIAVLLVPDTGLVSEQEIREAGAKAEVIEDYPGDKYSPSGLLPGFTRAGRALHFQVSFAESDTTKIVTIYEPDPNEWIENRKRR
jgi:hypothetical protein